MAVPFSNTKLRVPKGFQNILECLAREVLRSQPDNIHEFAAAYFEKMLKVRSETGHDPAVHGAKLEDRNYNNEAFKKRTVDPGDPQQQQAAVTIQSGYRQHSAKSEVQAMREEDAATRIQAGFRGFIDREQVRTMKGDEGGEGDVGGTDEAKTAEEEEVDIDLNDPEVEKAAIKIQAGFKGFKARKDASGSDIQDEGDKEEEAPRSGSGHKKHKKDLNMDDPEVADAALRIQAGFRGHQARQEFKAKQDEEAAKAGVTQEAAPVPEAAGTTEQTTAEEEEIDIDLNDPEVEKAAVKIQAGFKGLKTRKSLNQQKTEDAPAAAAEPAAAETTTEPQQPAEEEVDIDLNDPETEKAALKIQAGFRGYQTRRDMGEKGKDQGGEEAKTEEVAATQEAAPAEDTPAEPAPAEEAPAETAQTTAEEEVVDIDLEDPEVEKAAMKIQAGFKGFKARKEIQEKKTDDEAAPAAEDVVDGGQPAQEAAAEGSAEVKAEAGEEETVPKEVAEGGD